MPQTRPIERYDSVNPHIPQRTQSIRSRAGSTRSSRRFSYQSTAASTDDGEDEFVDAEEYVVSSRQPSVRHSPRANRLSIRRDTDGAPQGDRTARIDEERAQFTVRLETPRVTVAPPWEDTWVVPMHETQQYGLFFERIDSLQRGFINGEQAVPFFQQSGLSEAQLARIWDLSDINYAGTLNREEFALAMYLIKLQREQPHIALPTSRPANFVPPSRRQRREEPPLQWPPPQQPQQQWVPPPTEQFASEAQLPPPPPPKDPYVPPAEPNYVPSPPRPGSPATAYATSCCDCGLPSRDVSFCSACSESFCNRCWDRLILHRRNRAAAGGVPHEKVKPAVAEKVRKALAPPDNEELRERLHRDDASTSWFGIERPSDNGPPLFRDYGRLADLMQSTNPRGDDGSDLFVMDGAQAGRDTRTPSLVSFVGQTGAGKSTLIKLLIDLAADDTSQYPTPVIGAAGAHLPTSEDVHLYIDPHTSADNAPLLLADCEGLEGGEREPVGARFKKLGRLGKSAESNISDRISKALHVLSERELAWADAPGTRSRNFAVENLYPRLLYAFSDVIVFVLRNPRVVEHVFERLIKWAVAALETSSNQPLLPHCILVLNASDNDLDPSMWDAGVNTGSILDSLAKTVNKNETFKKYGQWWKERGKTIDNLEQLILCYYSSVVILRMPSNGRPKLMQEQVEKLYDGMISASMAARDTRHELRMLLDAEDFQSYLQSAFNHYAGTLQSPFDFVQASFANSPIPPDFGGNILKLAIHIMDRWKDRANAVDIFQQLSYMVASCIMFDSARKKYRGNADMIFPEYLDHIDAALENFCDQHWPCEYVKPGTRVRCVNVRSGHGAKGHQAANGKVIAAGDYISNFSFVNFQHKFRTAIWRKFCELLERVNRQAILLENYERAAAVIHRDSVLNHFYLHITTGSPVAVPYTSHTACFCCLFHVPNHALPCGHVLCTSCIRIYGHSRGPNDIELSECPIDACLRGTRPWRIHLKPKTAGVRVLLLDGGGMRGIVELEALKAIENELGGKIPARLMFDMVAGTSTGGIIALGIGVRCWSVDQSIRYFTSLCQKAFTARKGTDIWGIGPMIEAFHHSRYETEPLEDALKLVFTEDEYLFGGQRLNAPEGIPLKVAVTGTTMAGDRAVVFANYNRSTTEKTPYTFQRTESVANELKIWQAARATSAAPRFFKEFHHGPSKKVYVDGAIYHNNPVRIADQERKLIWPEIEEQYPDIVVSLGTAFSPSLHRVESTKMAAASQTGMIAHGTQLLGMLKNHMATSIQCERIWMDFLSTLPKGIKSSRFVRIDPELGVDVPQLDEVVHMERLQRSARQQFHSDNKIRTLALQLTAALFYWETYRQPIERPEGGYAVEGRLLCRFAPGTSEMVELGKYLARKARETAGLQFVVKEQDKVAELEGTYPLTNDMITRMMDDARFEMHLSLNVTSRLAKTEVSLFFSRKDWYPVSGFPRCLVSSEDRPSSQRLTVPTSNRWAGGSLRSRQARNKWAAPDAAEDTRTASDTIIDYANPDRGLQHRVHSIGDLASRVTNPEPSIAPSRRGGPMIRDAFRALLRRPAATGKIIDEKETVVDTYDAKHESESAIYTRWMSSLSPPNSFASGVSEMSYSSYNSHALSSSGSISSRFQPSGPGPIFEMAAGGPPVELPGPLPPVELPTERDLTPSPARLTPSPPAGDAQTGRRPSTSFPLGEASFPYRHAEALDEDEDEEFYQSRG